MFDIGFGELFLCFVIALVVLGPERLPKVARTVGRFTGQARAYMRNLSTELERETHAADIKKRLEEANRAARAELASFKAAASGEMQNLRNALPSSRDASEPSATEPTPPATKSE